jgi:hypothetical protein
MNGESWKRSPARFIVLSHQIERWGASKDNLKPTKMNLMTRGVQNLSTHFHTTVTELVEKGGCASDWRDSSTLKSQSNLDVGK